MKIKVKLKEYEEKWNKLIILLIYLYLFNDSSKYDDKYIIIRFNLDCTLPLRQELEIHNVVIIIRSFFMIIINIHK